MMSILQLRWTSWLSVNWNPPESGEKRGNISDDEHKEVTERALETKAKKEAKKHVADSLDVSDKTGI